jgi:multiple sugar transport system permease protein
VSEPPTANNIPAASVEPKRRRSSRRDGRSAFLMIGPNFALFSVFIVIPIVAGLYLSFTTWNITNGAPKWVGLANYTKMFNDPIVGVAVGNTVKFMLFGVIPTVFIALGLAMLINVRFRFVGVVRSLYLIPAAMSFAASAIVWRYIFLDGPGYGVVNWVISQFGIPPPNWLVSTTYALPALDVIAIWLSLPVATILYLAALQRIPASVIEAATLDGAGPIRRVRSIIWPMVRPMTILVAIVALLSFTNGSFDLVNILTPTGGTNYATATLVFYIYQQAFLYGLYGYASALAVLQIALIGGALAALRLFYLLGNRRG